MKLPKHIIFAGIVSVLFLTVGYSGSAGATETFRVSQRIKPLRCTVSAVQTGNTITYTYSLGCGGRQPFTKTIQPKLSTQPPDSTDSSIGELPPQDSGGGTTFLNQNDAITSPWGMPLLAKEGATYLFYLPGEAPNHPRRSLTIKQITVDGVLIYFEPGGIYKGVRVGDSIMLDLNNDSTPDIRIIVEYVNKNQGIASLRLFLYNNQVQPDRAKGGWVPQAVGLGTLLLVATGAHLYHRRRYPVLHFHWKAPHLY